MIDYSSPCLLGKSVAPVKNFKAQLLHRCSCTIVLEFHARHFKCFFHWFFSDSRDFPRFFLADVPFSSRLIAFEHFLDVVGEFSFLVTPGSEGVRILLRRSSFGKNDQWVCLECCRKSFFTFAGFVCSRIRRTKLNPSFHVANYNNYSPAAATRKIGVASPITTEKVWLWISVDRNLLTNAR